MTFNSILFERARDSIREELIEMPEFFVDLNLDQIIDGITSGRQEYNLKPFFYTPLHDCASIVYRHQVMQDLENEMLQENIRAFAQKMVMVRRYHGMIEKLYYDYHKKGWFLEAVILYCDAIQCLAHDLSRSELRSRGLLAFREYMMDYINSPGFISLLSETKELKEKLSTVKYNLLIHGRRVEVSKYKDEIDYSADVKETFEKFKQGVVKDYRADFPVTSGLNHVEAKVLGLVVRLYPDIFLLLDEFCEKNAGYLDETVTVFDREIQFYCAYLEYIAGIRRAGLHFCYPRINCKSKEVYDYEGFDLALAHKLVSGKTPVVCNDFYLKDKERIFVVSGPNQGGKTTFARTFGQVHYLARLGCPVPGRKAQLFVSDKILTHFEKQENIGNLRGKLQDDLVRIHRILDQATSGSIIIMNEIFTSTTLYDAVFLSKKVLKKVIQLDLLCVCVTFIDEVASFSEKIVSMVSTVACEDPAVRTYKIIRSPADGLSYAIAIAEKYHLTYEQLKERIES